MIDTLVLRHGRLDHSVIRVNSIRLPPDEPSKELWEQEDGSKFISL